MVYQVLQNFFCKYFIFRSIISLGSFQIFLHGFFWKYLKRFLQVFDGRSIQKVLQGFFQKFILVFLLNFFRNNFRNISRDSIGSLTVSFGMSAWHFLRFLSMVLFQNFQNKTCYSLRMFPKSSSRNASKTSSRVLERMSNGTPGNTSGDSIKIFFAIFAKFSKAIAEVVWGKFSEESLENNWGGAP